MSLDINFHEATSLDYILESTAQEALQEDRLGLGTPGKMLSTAHRPQNTSKPTEQTQTEHTTTPSEARLDLGILGNTPLLPANSP